MIISKINVDINVINLIKPMVFDDILLINTFENGICITQNINNISNFSIFIDKKYLTIHNLMYENSFVTSNIDNISNLNIEKIDNQIKINNEINTVNDVCNVCKKLINLKFNKTNFNYNNLNFDQKLNFLKDNKFEIVISDKFNGIVLKTKKHMFDLFINIIYTV
tara:strand:+ start:1377 stop:1871 length:495 start_codon:yes stop_codon:yes gene_type:complete